MQSTAMTVQAYLDTLSAERRVMIESVRSVIAANLDPAYAEVMQYGMMSWVIAHSVHPPGYHCKPTEPVPFAALASQKNYVALYLMGLYVGCTGTEETEELVWFRDAWAASGKKLDMGKACVRLKKLDDVPLEVIGAAIRRMPAQRYLSAYTQTLGK